MKRPAAEHGCLTAEAPAVAADGAAPITSRLPGRRVTAVLLLAAAALDLTRCGLVAATVRQGLACAGRTAGWAAKTRPAGSRAPEYSHPR